MLQRHHICVCICTYKRPDLLRKLLSKLEEQKTEGLFNYSIVIVDNDSSESARQMVESLARQSKTCIRYCVEPEQNIALARNKAVENAKGDFVAFIDDDEYPVGRWLVNLFKSINRYKSSGILGPVLPYFEKEPPKWVLKGHFFDRPNHPTGHVLEWKNTRTGNALIKREVFNADKKWFNPAFGSGGEDRDFFKRRIEKGDVFVWCNEALVYETVPPERWHRKIMIHRALLRGKMALNSGDSKIISILKSLGAILLYTGCLPLFLILGQHVLMKYMIKDCDHLGKILALFGIDWVKEKYVTG